MPDLTLHRDGVEQARVAVTFEQPQAHVLAPGDNLNAAITAGHPLIWLRGGSWGSWTRSNDTGRTSFCEVAAYPGETPQFGGVTLANTQRLRLRGLKQTGTFMFESATRFIEVFDHEQAGARVQLQRSGTGACTDLLFDGLHVHDVLEGTGGLNGYGVVANTNRTERVTVRGSLIERCQVDGIQFAATVWDLLVEDTVVRDIRKAAGSSAHSDMLQIVAACDRVTIRNSQFLNSDHPIRIAPSQSTAVIRNVTIDNILVDGVDNVAIQLSDGPGGPTENSVLRNSTFRNYDLPPSIKPSWQQINNIWAG